MGDTPTIPRFWWLRRLGAVVVVAVVAVVATHARLWWSSQSALAARIDAWRAEGLATPEDVPASLQVDLSNWTSTREIDYSFVPQASDNVASAVVAAIRATRAPPPQHEWTQAQRDYSRFGAESNRPLTDEEAAVARSVVAMYARPLALLRSAADRPRVDWGVPAATYRTGLALSECRNLARRARDAALVAHHEGNVGETAAAIGDVVTMSRATAEYGPSLVTLMVAVAIESLAVSVVEDLVRWPLPGHEAESERVAWRAGRSEVEALIRRLLIDEPARHDWFRRCLHGERVLIATVDYGYEFGLTGPLSIFSVPFAEHDKLLELSVLARMVAAVEANDELQPLQNAMAGPARLPATNSLAAMAAHPLMPFSRPGWTRQMVSLDFVARTSRHAAAVLLALRLYEADHDGELPATLEELVPAYLPAVPIDPTDPTGGPIKYDRDGPMPIVYACGLDGVDNGGSIGPPGTNFGDAWGGLDAVWPLRRSPDPDVNVYTYLYSLALPGDGVVDDLHVEDNERHPEADEDQQDRPGEE